MNLHFEEGYLLMTCKWLPDKKTPIFIVSNVKYNIIIGEIKWYSPWRKFCFFPYNDTLYDAKCLASISSFLFTITKQWKECSNEDKQQIRNSQLFR